MEDKLEQAYHIAAEIVQKFGDTYLPLFERLHKEMQERQGKQDLKNIAIALANRLKANNS